MTEIMAVLEQGVKETGRDKISEWLAKYEELRRYQGSLSEYSQERAIRFVINYCEFTSMTPKTLTDYSTTTKEKKTDEENKRLQDICDEWVNWDKIHPTIKKPLSISSMLGLVFSVRGFFRTNFLPLDKEVGENIHKLAPTEWDTYTPSRQDTINFRECFPMERGKILIHFVSTCPLRRNELRLLKWEDLKDFSEEYPYIYLPPKRLKGKYKGVQFVGIICKTLKEELIGWKKELIDYCQKNRFQWSESLPIFPKFQDKKGVPTIDFLSIEGIAGFVWRASKRMQKKYGEDKAISLHDFRRYFESCIDKAIFRGEVKVPPNYRRWMLGHVLEGVDPNYNNAEVHIPAIVEMFKDLEPYLDIDLPEPKESKRERLERENLELKEEIKRLKAEQQIP